MTADDPAFQELPAGKMDGCLCSNCAPADVPHLLSLLPFMTRETTSHLVSLTGVELEEAVNAAQRTAATDDRDVHDKNDADGPSLTFVAKNNERRDLNASLDTLISRYVQDHLKDRVRLDVIWPEILSK